MYREGDSIFPLIEEFKKILDTCERDSSDKESILVNLVNVARFLFLCKFVASLKPISNKSWQNAINMHLSTAMKNHVDAMMKQTRKEADETKKNFEPFKKFMS